ncbi:hypothetical protein [Sinorhizobium meliloti]|uniref:hypothetical protein n=1 Tax=Rhizobium meliloti TaxID=382 RepID=UPI0013E35A38|nr:hypothetical protein [Sinorhizobium meliloti]
MRELAVHTGIAFDAGLLDSGGTEGDRPVEYTLRLTLGLAGGVEGAALIAGA